MIAATEASPNRTARPAVQYFFQFYICGRITQNVAHNDLSAVFFVSGKQSVAFFLAVGNRFFQKYVVTQRQRLFALRDVTTVQSRYNKHVSG